jgi:hypothetical protein
VITPVACSYGHDEDADLLDDCDDPCPADTGDATDTDADGVGDACDPDPVVWGEQRVLFDPFTTLAPAWVAPDATAWTLDGESITVTTYEGAANAFIERTDVGRIGDVQIEMAATVYTFPLLTADTARMAGVVARTSGNNGHVCDVRFSDFAYEDAEVRLLSAGSGGTVQASHVGFEDIPAYQQFRVRCQVRGDLITSTASSYAVGQAQVNDASYALGGIGMRVRLLDLRIHWISVTALGP